MIDLDQLAYDIAQLLGTHGLPGISSASVRRSGLIPLVDTLAPDALTAAQRFGLDVAKATTTGCVCQGYPGRTCTAPRCANRQQRLIAQERNDALREQLAEDSADLREIEAEQLVD